MTRRQPVSLFAPACRNTAARYSSCVPVNRASSRRPAALGERCLTRLSWWPGMVSFAGGLPSADTFPLLAPGVVPPSYLQYGPGEGEPAKVSRRSWPQFLDLPAVVYQEYGAWVAAWFSGCGASSRQMLPPCLPGPSISKRRSCRAKHSLPMRQPGIRRYGSISVMRPKRMPSVDGLTSRAKDARKSGDDWRR